MMGISSGKILYNYCAADLVLNRGLTTKQINSSTFRKLWIIQKSYPKKLRKMNIYTREKSRKWNYSRLYFTPFCMQSSRTSNYDA